MPKCRSHALKSVKRVAARVAHITLSLRRCHVRECPSGGPEGVPHACEASSGVERPVPGGRAEECLVIAAHAVTHSAGR